MPQSSFTKKSSNHTSSAPSLEPIGKNKNCSSQPSRKRQKKNADQNLDANASSTSKSRTGIRRSYALAAGSTSSSDDDFDVFTSSCEDNSDDSDYILVEPTKKRKSRPSKGNKKTTQEGKEGKGSKGDGKGKQGKKPVLLADFVQEEVATRSSSSLRKKRKTLQINTKTTQQDLPDLSDSTPSLLTIRSSSSESETSKKDDRYRHVIVQDSQSSSRDINKYISSIKKTHENLLQDATITVSTLHTCQGRDPGSTNGCAVITGCIVSEHLHSSDCDVSDEDISNIIDVECIPILRDIRTEQKVSETSFLEYNDVHRFLEQRGLLDAQSFVGIFGGNIFDKSNLGNFLNSLEDASEESTIAVAFHYNQHVISILKAKEMNCFFVIDSLGSSRNNFATRTKCNDIHALKIHLEWISIQGFHHDTIASAMVDKFTMTEDDARVFQAFVYSSPVQKNQSSRVTSSPTKKRHKIQQKSDDEQDNISVPPISKSKKRRERKKKVKQSNSPSTTSSKSTVSQKRKPSNQKKKLKWTDEEDAIVIDAVTNSSEQPFTRWSDLAQRLPRRNNLQVRQRWIRHLNPNINHHPFSMEEDLQLWDGYKKLGKQWVEISKKFFNSNRSENQLMNRWNSVSFKKIINNKVGPEAALSTANPRASKHKRRVERIRQCMVSKTLSQETSKILIGLTKKPNETGQTIGMLISDGSTSQGRIMLRMAGYSTNYLCFQKRNAEDLLANFGYVRREQKVAFCIQVNHDGKSMTRTIYHVDDNDFFTIAELSDFGYALKKWHEGNLKGNRKWMTKEAFTTGFQQFLSSYQNEKSYETQEKQEKRNALAEKLQQEIMKILTIQLPADCNKITGIYSTAGFFLSGEIVQVVVAIIDAFGFGHSTTESNFDYSLWHNNFLRHFDNQEELDTFIKAFVYSNIMCDGGVYYREEGKKISIVLICQGDSYKNEENSVAKYLQKCIDQVAGEDGICTLWKSEKKKGKDVTYLRVYKRSAVKRINNIFIEQSDQNSCILHKAESMKKIKLLDET